MSTNTPTQENGTDSPLTGETTHRQIPAEWIADAPDAELSEGETRYYATLYTVERELAEADVLAGRTDGRAEQWTVHVLYTRADGQRRVSRHLDASVVETSEGLDVTPKDFQASISVDGDHVTPHSAPCSEEIQAALRELHDIDPTGDA